MGKPKIIIEDFEDMINFKEEPETVPAQTGIEEMNFDRMESFPDHKFKLYEGQRLVDMAESIKQHGILLPLIVWHTQDDKHIILSGHNRRNAAGLAGLNKGPIIVKENLTLAEATLIVTETNLHQRSFADMSHSERAYCLSQHYEALKSQGKRSDLLLEIQSLLDPDEIRGNSTSSECQTKLRTDEKIGKNYGLSRDKVAKYIRIAKLLPSILAKVDENKIGFLAAYEISFVENPELQQNIVEFMESDDLKMDIKKAELLRNHYEAGKLNDDGILQILNGEKTRKPKSDKPKPVQIKPSVLSKYFTPEHTQKEITGIIEQALQLFFQVQNAEVNQETAIEEIQ